MGDYLELWAWLDRLLDSHISIFEGHAKQGSAEWLKNKKKIVGGSELASLMGWNPYTKWNALLAKKLGLAVPNPPGIACWWGTMFEPVSERILELHCSTKVKGTSIHMRYPWLEFHGNSPDGYCVVQFRETEDAWELAHGPKELVSESSERAYPVPVLIELKAPYRRLPDGRVPKYYTPQVWSGLCLSTIAVLGLFVEVVYRLCSFDQLGVGPGYSLDYHRGDKKANNRDRASWKGAFAWGATAVYAPKLGTRKGRLEQGEKLDTETLEADMVAYKALCEYFGEVVRGEELGHRYLDLGELADIKPASFDNLMKMIDKKAFKVRHSDPQFADPEVADRPESLGQFTHRAETDPALCPEHYYLLGYIPWKVFQVDYHVIHREDGFIYQIMDLTSRFMGEVEMLREAEDVARAYSSHCQKKDELAGKKPKEPKVPKSAMSALFSRVAARAAETTGRDL